MTVSEDGQHALAFSQPYDNALDARPDIGRSLAARTTISPHSPVGSRLADLRSRQPLVVAVVPLPQVLIDNGQAKQISELTRLSRPSERRREHRREGLRRHIRAKAT